MSTTLFDDEEKIINWVEEATAIINDVKTHVAAIEISRVLPSNESCIYLNLRTIEGKDFCVQVSSMGFRIVANAYDTVDAEDKNDEEEYYETPYALLDKISPRYIESFGSQLCQQLLNLQQNTYFNEEDEDNIADEDSISDKDAAT